MDIQKIVEKIQKLEYHQQLLLKVIENNHCCFYKLIVEKSLGEKEVKEFEENCEKMSMKMEEQKAEGLVYFHPLYIEFKSLLHPVFKAEDVIMACIKQRLYLPLMEELRKYF
ncbi:hypothetical protein J2Z40_001638 [Cytobacillus eiseniae]|uniref:DUF1878 family protein n=1 Tax=Cytobacillus eiseniae TaxID=762947 RepID=A0ABS4RFB2_9BACI|nr:hypothetical protein [Cytobacillus eiseniae]